jgi:MFS family permease
MSPSAIRRDYDRYAWVIFALTFGLLISDYMSRQVLNAVFPLLKAEWTLTDAQLGSLSGIVALMVGLLTVPLSFLADRWGRVKSLTLMAVLWSLATLLCAYSQSFAQMFAGRFMVGIGEAAYGSVGIALVLSAFPERLRATLSAAFMAGGMMGSVLGLALGGVLANVLGWRYAFGAMALFGLMLALIYPLLVRDPRPQSAIEAATPMIVALKSVWRGAQLPWVYFGSGLQLFVSASLMAWLPSFLNRQYQWDTATAGLTAGGLVFIGGIGMVVSGYVADRIRQQGRYRAEQIAMAYCLCSAIGLLLAFSVPAGAVQLVSIAIAMFFCAATTGPAGALVAALTPAAIHGTAFAMLTLMNNLLGLAPGPYLTGVLADIVGLRSAFMVLLPLMSLLSAFAFCAVARKSMARAARVSSL